MDYLSGFSRTMSLRNILLYLVSSIIFSGCANAPLATSAPSLMPNTRGSRIAFVASPTDTKNLLEVYSIGVDGTDLQQLTKNIDGMNFYLPGDIKWSPDGNFIAFCLFPGGSYVMKLDGSGPHLLDKVGCHPSWSPDGKTIALISKHDSYAQLYAVDLINFNLRQLTQSESDVTKALWSPDGVHILFELFDHKIYVLDTTSLKETMLTSESELSQWSPDGRLIAVVSSQNVKNSVNELFIMNADGTNLKQLTDNVPVSTPAMPETQSDMAAE